MISGDIIAMEAMHLMKVTDISTVPADSDTPKSVFRFFTLSFEQIEDLVAFALSS